MRPDTENRKSPTKIQIILPIFLLIGIILIAYGFYNDLNLPFYLGLLVTIAGVIEGIIKFVVNKE